MPRSTATGRTREATTDLAALMEEPPHGFNHGRKAVDDPHLETSNGRKIDLSVEGAQSREVLQTRGWTLIPGVGGARQAAGMTAHRGVLHPDEYVNRDELRARIEDAFGFTFEEVRSVYRQGRLSPAQGELRARIDARFLALSRAGANMAALARCFGFKSAEDTWPRALKNAMARAKAAEVAS